MDFENPPHGGSPKSNDDGTAPEKKPRILPDDLPKSLDDRRTVPEYAGETEMYDGWQGSFASASTGILHFFFPLQTRLSADWFAISFF